MELVEQHSLPLPALGSLRDSPDDPEELLKGRTDSGASVADILRERLHLADFDDDAGGAR